MKLRAILEGNELIFPHFVVFKKPKIEVEVELPDQDVEIYSEEDIEKMSLDELAHLIWDRRPFTEEELAHINKDYKELVREALGKRCEE